MIQNKVYLKHDTHQYFSHEGTEYTSVSRVLGGLKEPFDEQFWSKKKAQELGVTQKEVLDMWDRKRRGSTDHGTRVHDAIERYTKTYEIEKGNEDLEPMLISIASDYKSYYRALSEVILYSPELEKLGTMVAGTTDRLLFIDRKQKYIDIEDYKTNLERGIEFFPKKKNGDFFPKYKYAPVSHLTDCNYHTYCLQLSIYGVMAEQLTEAKVRMMWLRFIPANNPLAHYRIPVPYMKKEAEEILSVFHNKNKGILTEAPSFG